MKRCFLPGQSLSPSHVLLYGMQILFDRHLLKFVLSFLLILLTNMRFTIFIARQTATFSQSACMIIIIFCVLFIVSVTYLNFPGSQAVLLHISVSSSLPSAQSFSPSHLQLRVIHSPFVHLNCSGLQPVLLSQFFSSLPS